MAGTKQGGEAAARTNKEKYGEDFYKRIGSRGGKNGHTGGFWHTKYVLQDDEKIREAGAKGGYISRRRSDKVVEAGVKKSWLKKLTGNK